LAVDDMYASVTPDSIEVRVLLPDGSRELVDGTVMAEIESGDRLSIRVSMQAPSWLTFEVELLAKRRGRVVLPLTVGPIEVVHTLPRPLLGAQWSRHIALLLGCGAAASGEDDVADGAHNRTHPSMQDFTTASRPHRYAQAPSARGSGKHFDDRVGDGRLRERRAKLVAVLVLQAAAWLLRRRVVDHLHDQRPARAHLNLAHVEAELFLLLCCGVLVSVVGFWFVVSGSTLQRMLPPPARQIAAHPEERLEQRRLAIALAANSDDLRDRQAARLAKRCVVLCCVWSYV
jgi:hypothetical protein